MKHIELQLTLALITTTLLFRLFVYVRSALATENVHEMETPIETNTSDTMALHKVYAMSCEDHKAQAQWQSTQPATVVHNLLELCAWSIARFRN